MDYEDEQKILKKSKAQAKLDAISFYKQSKLKTQLFKQLQQSMQVGDSTHMEEESLVPKYWRDYLENDHLPIYNIDIETLKKRDKVILKDMNTLDESDM